MPGDQEQGRKEVKPSSGGRILTEWFSSGGRNRFADRLAAVKPCSGGCLVAERLAARRRLAAELPITRPVLSA